MGLLSIFSRKAPTVKSTVWSNRWGLVSSNTMFSKKELLRINVAASVMGTGADRLAGKLTVHLSFSGDRYIPSIAEEGFVTPGGSVGPNDLIDRVMFRLEGTGWEDQREFTVCATFGPG